VLYRMVMLPVTLGDL